MRILLFVSSASLSQVFFRIKSLPARLSGAGRLSSAVLLSPEEAVLYVGLAADPQEVISCLFNCAL